VDIFGLKEIATTLIVGSFAILIVWAYVRESLELDKRTFGYYESLVFETANPISKAVSAGEVGPARTGAER
jgi:hypothetical protein